MLLLGYRNVDGHPVLRVTPWFQPVVVRPEEWSRPPRHGGRVLNVLTYPHAEAAEEAVRLLRERGTLPQGLGPLRKCELNQAGARGERRPACGLGEPGDAQGLADANLLVENQSRELAHAGELRRSTREHDSAARHLVEAARLEGVPHELEGFLDPGRDDTEQDRLRHVRDLAVFLFAHLGHRYGLALVCGRG